MTYGQFYVWPGGPLNWPLSASHSLNCIGAHRAVIRQYIDLYRLETTCSMASKLTLDGPSGWLTASINISLFVSYMVLIVLMSLDWMQAARFAKLCLCVVSMLAHRLRRWAGIETTQIQRLVGRSAMSRSHAQRAV